METKKLGILATAMTALMLSVSAFASDQARTASGPGPGTEEAGSPVTGSNCYFAYSIQKLGPLLVQEGEYAEYFVFVQNLGNCKLRHIKVKDWLPKGADFIESWPHPESPVSTLDGNHKDELRFEIDDLKPGRLEAIKIKVKFDERVHNPIQTNIACAFTPWIGTQICDSVNTTVYKDHHD